MKEWTSPEIRELDVRLTEKGPGTVERVSHFFNGWQTATYDANIGDVSVPQNGQSGLS